MSGRRSSLRRSAWIAFAAILLSLVSPAGAHTHGTPPGFGGHADFCSANGPAPHPAPPAAPGHDTKVCTHCPGCTGSAGNTSALPAPPAPSIAVQATLPQRVVNTPPVAKPVDVIAARPRGPPPFA